MNDKKRSIDLEIELQLEELSNKGIIIPKQPKVLLKIIELTQSPRFQVRQLAAQVRKDPGLSAQILYIVNSPAYGFTDEISSIEDAITILGVDRTLNLCRAVLLREAINSTSPALEIFWKRSAIVAELTVAIAHRQRVNVSSDLAYLAGLFHACGIAFLISNLPGYGDALINEAAWVQLEKHSHNFAVDHVSISYLLSRAWNLPKLVTESIFQQREFIGYRIRQNNYDQNVIESTNKQCAGLVSSLQLALLLYNRLLLNSCTSEWEVKRDSCLAILGMSKEQFDSFA